MEAITKTPGLQHISEKIFKLLSKKTLMNCRLVNSSWKNVLDQPMFWLEKLSSQDNNTMSSDIQKSWKILVQKVNDKQISNELALILTKICNGKKQFHTFDIIMKLARGKIYPDLLKFMLENENPNSQMDISNVTGFPSCMTKLKPIH